MNVKFISDGIRSTYHLYADDLAIAFFEKDLDTTVGQMNNNIVMLQTPDSGIRLKLNAGKFQALILLNPGSKFRRRIDYEKENYPCVVNGIPLNYSTSVIFLRTKIDGGRSWYSQISSLRGKLGCSIRALKTLSATVLPVHCSMLHHALREPFSDTASQFFHLVQYHQGKGCNFYKTMPYDRCMGLDTGLL